MSAPDAGLREQSIRQYCRLLRLPTVGSQFGRLAEEAVKQHHSPVRYLEALLAAEIEERERNAVTRRIFEAKLPRVKTLEEFDFGQAPHISAARLQQLAEGLYIRQAEPVLFIGELCRQEDRHDPVCPNGTPYSGCPATCSTKCPFRRS